MFPMYVSHLSPLGLPREIRWQNWGWKLKFERTANSPSNYQGKETDSNVAAKTAFEIWSKFWVWLYPVEMSQIREFNFLMPRSWPLFLYFRVFYKQFTVNMFIKVADDWVRTRVLWYRKRTLCQLCHNHCQWTQNFVEFFIVTMIRASEQLVFCNVWTVTLFPIQLFFLICSVSCGILPSGYRERLVTGRSLVLFVVVSF